MADQEQLERLARSVEEWNQWRRQQPDLRSELRPRPDLTGIGLTGTDLSRANLSGADLRWANLSRANLSGADLSQANLSEADLSQADLSRAHLSQAILSGTNLSKADLSMVYLNHADLSMSDLNETDLSGTILSGTNLSGANLGRTILNVTDLAGANLNGADLTGAILSGTNLLDVDFTETNLTQAYFVLATFARVDLSNVRGLETTIHKGPSFVDINSVTLPLDKYTRLHFLRGVGFTETQIEYLPSLLTPRPIEYSSLFISYAHQDEVIAKRLYADLRKKDVPCWFAPHDLRPGTPILRGLEEAIRLQEKFLLILSKHAVKSEWIKQEVDAALYQEIKRQKAVLFPVRLDDTILECSDDWAVQLQRRHIGDFTDWQDDASYQQAFATLLQHLKVTKSPPTV